MCKEVKHYCIVFCASRLSKACSSQFSAELQCRLAGDRCVSCKSNRTRVRVCERSCAGGQAGRVAFAVHLVAAH